MFFPCHVSAFMVSPLGSAYFALSFPGFETSCAVVALSPWPRSFSTPSAACDIAILEYSSNKLLEVQLRDLLIAE